MPDESTISRGAVWARIRVTAVPVDPRQHPKETLVGVEVCQVPDRGDAVGFWMIELHTEGAVPASMGAHKILGQESVETVPQEVFHAEAFFRSAATLTHVKSRCETLKGAHFTKAVKLPEALVFMPGDRARVEIQVFREPAAAPIVTPSVEIFQEPELGHAPASRGRAQLGSANPGLPAVGFRAPMFRPTGRIPTRPIGLFY